MIHGRRTSFSLHSFQFLALKSFVPPPPQNKSIRPQHQSLLSTRPTRKMDNLPTTYAGKYLHPSSYAPLTTHLDAVPIAIIGGTGLSSLPSPLFEPLALIPPTATPWGLPSSPIAILRYTPISPSTGLPSVTSTVVAFLARHGAHHQYAPHEIPNRANVAALKKLGVKAAVGFSAVGSLREEVKPRDFLVAGGVVDWTKGVSL